jgi:hypothetical protein
MKEIKWLGRGCGWQEIRKGEVVKKAVMCDSEDDVVA